MWKDGKGRMLGKRGGRTCGRMVRAVSWVNVEEE